MRVSQLERVPLDLHVITLQLQLLGSEKNPQACKGIFEAEVLETVVRKQRGEEISPALTVLLLSSSVLTYLCFFVLPYLPIGIKWDKHSCQGRSPA